LRNFQKYSILKNKALLSPKFEPSSIFTKISKMMFLTSEFALEISKIHQSSPNDEE
jgi:hypothetical protein